MTTQLQRMADAERVLRLEPVRVAAVRDAAVIDWTLPASFMAACMYGRLDMMQWLAEKNMLDPKQALCAAAAWGYVHVLSWLAENFTEDTFCSLRVRDHEAVLMAAVRGNACVLDWIEKNSNYFTDVLPPARPGSLSNSPIWVAAEGHTAVLDWLFERGYITSESLKGCACGGALRNALAHDQFASLLWLEKHGAGAMRDYGDALDLDNDMGDLSAAARDWLMSSIDPRAAREAADKAWDGAGTRQWTAPRWTWVAEWWDFMKKSRQQKALTLLLCERRLRRQLIPAEVWERCVAPHLHPSQGN